MPESEQRQDDADQPTSAASRTRMLLDFLREHDAPCPVCGYNLRGLTRPVCPECRHDLVLAVGAAQPRLLWLLVALAPGFFSGIAASFVLIPIVGRLVFGDGRWMRPFVALDLFGWSSAALAIIITAQRLRFIAQPQSRQRWWAIVIWSVHVAAFGLFLLFARFL
jgi:hypothetical protein